MHPAAPQAAIETASNKHNHVHLVPSIVSFSDFVSQSHAADQLPAVGSSDSLLTQSCRSDTLLGNQPPISLPRDTNQHCLHCGLHPTEVETSDTRQPLYSRVEGLELAVIQLQILQRSGMTNHDVQLANMAQQVDDSFLNITTSIGQIKDTLGKFLERFADDLGHDKEETSEGDGTSTQHRIAENC
ncbi:uncharacterized protein LMH87_007637 [Akanthomyces muscarius]|uniref:Uncharacterized protein n=1 Tax=Akanthomyces muscarius TaxID=2231603 RepID=A0A9W8UQ01_AKAMU|nr:uncharacterized protein LMH87_007637 [Akanthomyces muscarius]KAJ4161607.1 hypothetical protein LMH87_007637 [Akanthomyces muscarius]